MPKEGEEEEVATIPGMAMTAVVVAADTDPTPRDHAGGGRNSTQNIRVLSAVALHTGRVTNQKKKIRTRQVIRQSGRR